MINILVGPLKMGTMYMGYPVKRSVKFSFAEPEPQLFPDPDQYNVCPRSSDPFRYFIRWVTTSWTYSTFLFIHLKRQCKKICHEKKELIRVNSIQYTDALILFYFLLYLYSKLLYKRGHYFLDI